MVVTALYILAGVAGLGVLSSGWIAAYVQRGKRADAELSVAANKSLAASRLTALEKLEAELGSERKIRRAADGDVEDLAGQLDATRHALAALPTECDAQCPNCGTRCGADVRAEVDQVLWAAGAEVGLMPPEGSK